MKHEIPFDIEKQVHWSISRIDSFQKERAYKIILNSFPINNSIATVSKNDNEGFTCKIFMDKLHDYTYNQNPERFGIFESMILESTGDKYFIPENSVSNVSLTLSIPQVITLNIRSFQSGPIEEFENRKLRLIIPIETEPSFNIIDFKSLKVNNSVTFSGAIEINIKGLKYQMFKHNNDDAKKKYIIIDSIECNTFQEFKANCHAIITAFGYLSGKLFLDDYYYQTFQIDNPDLVDNILYEKKEQSVLLGQPLFDPLRFSEYVEAIGKKEKLNRMNLTVPTEVFSKLCETIKTNESYSRCCQLIIEGNQSKQTLLRAGIYSIAIETLTNIIYEENKNRINPIDDKKLVRLIQDKFRNILTEYDEFISDYGKKIINSKINDINQPTNSKKLSVPFEIYRIKLSKDDLDILNHRNKFLHGTSPFGNNDLKNKENELQFIVARLQFMLNSLMLKYIGYTGHIINYPAWIQFNSKEKPTDHLFRII